MASRIAPRSCSYYSARPHLHHPSRRSLTTSPSTRAPQPTTTRIPPESPNFIHVPSSLQPHQIQPKWMKGVLPVPRKLFPPSAPDKTSPTYLASATPPPSPHNLNRKHNDPRAADLAKWKARQSELRRENLRQSLIELRFRKEGTDRKVAASSARVRADNKARREAPELEDERLTAATVLQADKLRRHVVLADPNRSSRLATKRQNLAAHRAREVEERREMLHKLYIHAGYFITTAEQLDKMVDRAFDDLTQFASDSQGGNNIWNTGEPQTTMDMLGMGTRMGQRKVLDDQWRKKTMGEERMRVIGEELTGGMK